MANEHDASRDWIRNRINELATAAGMKVVDVQFSPDRKGFGDVLILTVREQRVTEEISSVTLDDLMTDSGEQANMDLRLRRVISRLKTTSGTKEVNGKQP